MFKSVETKRDHGHIELVDGQIEKIEGVGNVRLRLHDDVVQRLQNVRFVLTT